MRRTPTNAQRAEMLREAERHERVAAALREIAEHGEPSAATLDAAPILNEWTWDSNCTPVLVGGVGSGLDVRRSRGVLFLSPTADAALTDDGWYRLGLPREAVVRRGWQQ